MNFGESRIFQLTLVFSYNPKTFWETFTVGASRMVNSNIIPVWLEHLFFHLWVPLFFAHPRTYPPKFALKIARLRERFCSKRTLYFRTHLEEGNIALGLYLFELLPWDSDRWDDARMESVLFLPSRSEGLEAGQCEGSFPYCNLISFLMSIDLIDGSYIPTSLPISDSPTTMNKGSRSRYRSYNMTTCYFQNLK